MSDSDKNLSNLGMSDEAGTLFYAVKKHIEDNVDLLTEDY
jgi:hypothetical protein